LVRLFLETGNFDEKTPQSERKENPVPKLQAFDDLKKQLSNRLGTKVQLTCNQDGKGKITIPFANDEELARIMDLFDKI